MEGEKSILEVVLEAGDLVQVTAELLRLCRTHEAALRAELCARRGLFRDLREEAARELPILESLFTDRAEAAAFARLLGSLASKARSMPLAARSLAEAIDDRYGPDFYGWFRAEDTIRLQAGDPFPVARRPAKALFGHAANSLPEHLSVNVDGLQHLRIAPNELGPFELIAYFKHEDVIVPLARGDRIGTGAPYRDIDDFEIHRHGTREDPCFFGVSPKDREGQRDVLRRMLEAAEDCAVSVLVLPELCIDELGLRHIEEWWNEQPRGVRLLAAGSQHRVDANGKRRNCATILLRRGPACYHNKFNPFIFPASAGADANRREDISIEPARIELHFTAGYSVCTLICKDLVESKAASILGDMRVNLVLVPAFSAKTSGFEDAAAQLARSAQTVVIVANTPAGPGADQVVIRLPRAKGLLTLATPVPAGSVAWVELAPEGKLTTR